MRSFSNPTNIQGIFSTRMQVNNLDYSYALRDITDMFNVTYTCTREWGGA